MAKNGLVETVEFPLIGADGADDLYTADLRASADAGKFRHVPATLHNEPEGNG